MNRLSRASIVVFLSAGVLWAEGVADAGRLPSAVTVCVNASSSVVRLVASKSNCVGGAQTWAASKSAPLLCWEASSLKPLDRSRVVSVAPSSGCAAPLRSVPVGKVLLLCAGGKSGILRWPITKVCKSGNLQTWIRSVATVAPTTTTVAPTSTSTVAPTSTSTVAPTSTSTVAPTSTTTVAPTCATGGSCIVGVSTGAGGGKVFYYSSTAFTSIGSDCGNNCHYLEAAPTTGGSAWTDVKRTWAAGSNQTALVSGADGTAIGTGYRNTLDIVAQSGNVASSSAAVEAQAYRGPNNLSGWFLPSRDELNQLYRNKTQVGGFLPDSYWSSSEADSEEAAFQYFSSGAQGNDVKFYSSYLRPVRAG